MKSLISQIMKKYSSLTMGARVVESRYIITKVNNQLICDAEKYFPEKYRNILKKKRSYEKSLCARFLVSKLVKEMFQKENYFPEINNNPHTLPLTRGIKGVCSSESPSASSIFWSTSYSDNFIVVVVDDKKIGIDIEVSKRRNEAVFSVFSNKEWGGMGAKSWEKFYQLWTAKESAVKYFDLQLEDMNELEVLTSKKNRVSLLYKKKIKDIQVFQTSDYTLSLCSS